MTPVQVCETGGGKIGDSWHDMSGNIQRLSTYG